VNTFAAKSAKVRPLKEIIEHSKPLAAQKPPSYMKTSIRRILDFPDFLRHSIALLSSSMRGVYAWLKKYGEASPQQANQHDLATENASLAAAAAELTDDLGIIDLAGLAAIGIEYI